MKTPNLDNVIKKFARDVIGRAQRNIGATRNVDGKKRRTDTTGTLRTSLVYHYKNKRLTFGASGDAEKYAPFVEYGRNPGKQPPPEAILEWINKKPIRLRDKSGGFIEATESRKRSLAYLIGRKIGTKGTEGILYYNRAMNEAFRDWDDKIIDAYLLDVDINIGL